MKLTKLSSTGNFTKLHLRVVDVYFSYETPIALVHRGFAHISNNEWGTTTGKHINTVKREYEEHAQMPHSELASLIDLYI